MFDKKEISAQSQKLVIELAKSLNIDFPKDKTCKDCFDYKFESVPKCCDFIQEHHCWNKNKTTIRPCDPDDMSHMDYTDPYKIENLEEAISCPYYKSGLEEYKRLYEQSKKELDKLKSDIKNLCQ